MSFEQAASFGKSSAALTSAAAQGSGSVSAPGGTERRRQRSEPRSQHQKFRPASGRWRQREHIATHGRVSARPQRRTVQPNETFSVRLLGRDFDQATEGGSVDLAFNPRAVRVLDITVDAATWEFFQSTGSIDESAGRVDGLAFASFTGRSGTFPIATVRFQSVATAPQPLELTLHESARNPFASRGHRLDVTFD